MGDGLAIGPIGEGKRDTGAQWAMRGHPNNSRWVRWLEDGGTWTLSRVFRTTVLASRVMMDSWVQKQNKDNSKKVGTCSCNARVELVVTEQEQKLVLERSLPSEAPRYTLAQMQDSSIRELGISFFCLSSNRVKQLPYHYPNLVNGKTEVSWTLVWRSHRKDTQYSVFLPNSSVPMTMMNLKARLFGDHFWYHLSVTQVTVWVYCSRKW